MKASICVALLVLLLGIAFDVVLSTSTDACEAFWKGVTPLFPDAGGEGPKGKGKAGKKTGKRVARQEPGERKPPTPPILTQALRWHKPNEMLLYVEDSAASPLARGTCKCQKEDVSSSKPTLSVSTSTESSSATGSTATQV